MKLSFIYILLFLLISCIKDADYFNIENLNNNEVTILGHRGMGELFKYPGNTLEAIIPVIEIGAKGTEIDIQMTKDSILVLFHNGDMKLRTNCDFKIHEHNWAEISYCKYIVSLPDVNVITVDKLFNNLENLNNLIFSFDCKIPVNSTESHYKKFARSIKSICEKFQMTDNVYIEGNEYFIKILQEVGLTNKFFVTGTGNIHKSIDIAKELNTFGVAIDQKYVTKEDVRKAHEKGLFVMLWGAKTRAESKTLLKKNPDIIQSDKPIYILKIFKQFNYDYNIP